MSAWPLTRLMTAVREGSGNSSGNAPVARRAAYRVAWLGGAIALLGGCATGLGPRAVRSERPDYNRQIVHSADAEMLLNLVRLRYNDTPLFLELDTVVTQYGLETSLSAGAQAGDGAFGTFGTGVMYGEKPTITYAPLAGDKFATRLLTPIPLDALMLFGQTGWSQDRLLLVTVQRVNDLFNAPSAAGPTPQRQPDYASFADFAQRFQRLQTSGLAGLRRGPDEVGVRCRSLLGVMYFLAQSVEPPAADVEAGLVTVTRDDEGQPFDWSRVTGDVMRIRSQPERPEHAYVAVQYRGSWFYIADDDQSSKSTFSLVNFLLSLLSESSQGKSPILTLPVGN